MPPEASGTARWFFCCKAESAGFADMFIVEVEDKRVHAF